MAEEDLFLIICQNNERRSVKIKEASEGLAQVLGRLRSEMEGLELAEFLSDHSADAITDYLEFADDSEDVDVVLSRVREFKMKHHSGEEILFAQKCYRDTPRDEHQWFRLSLKDERRQIEEKSLPELLKENLAGVYAQDESTGLANRTTCERYLDQVANYVSTHEVTGCFAVLRLDRYQKSLAQYGQSGCDKLVQHIAQHCKGRFREEDLVSYLGDDCIGLLLMDTLEESARIVLNRLRSSIASHRMSFGDKTNFSVTVSIAFTEMLGESGQDVMARAERAISAIDDDERSQLVKAGL
jgi:diguanylate cyclase (GGDEF)-like protein